jgi:hypothetical protein
VRTTWRVVEAGRGAWAKGKWAWTLGPKALFKMGARSPGVERGRDGAGGYYASAIGHVTMPWVGHVLGHLKDVGRAGVRDRAGGLGVVLLLGHGAVRVEADGAALRVGGAGDRDGLGVDPGVGPEELVRVACPGCSRLTSR